MSFHDWAPYKPDDYPIQDKHHNPWVTIDPISGATAYRVWMESRPISEADFRAKLAELKGQSEQVSACVNVGHNQINCQVARVPREHWCEACRNASNGSNT